MQLEPEPVYLAVPASHLPNSFGNASSAIVAPVVSQIVSATILIGWAAFSYVGTSVVDADDGAISLINVWPIVQTALLLQVLCRPSTTSSPPPMNVTFTSFVGAPRGCSRNRRALSSHEHQPAVLHSVNFYRPRRRACTIDLISKEPHTAL